MILYTIIAIISFICFVKYEQKTSGFHNNNVILFFHLIFSIFWFIFVPIFLIDFLLGFVSKLITGEMGKK